MMKLYPQPVRRSTEKQCEGGCQTQFQVTDEDRQFYEKVSPVFGGKKYLILEPALCPDCRRQKRLSFRNERNLYKRSCDLCKRDIVSMYSPDKPFTVYCPKCWWSDKWKAQDYARDVDFSRPFFEQVNELSLKVPRLSLISSPDAEEMNCSYVNFSGNSKNCFMTFDSDFNEDSFYTKVLKHSKNCVDCAYVTASEKCYECVECTKSYNLFYSQDCSNCTDSYFLKNCIGAKNCVFSVNLVQKQYYIRNKPYSKEEYFQKLEEMGLHDASRLEGLKNEFKEYIKTFPVKYAHQLNTENTTGEYIVDSKDCQNCFNIGDGQDLKYCDHLYSARDCFDVSSFGEKIEKVYESGTIGINTYNILFGFTIVESCSDLLYSIDMRSSKNCFGCVSVWRGQYNILNKQYSPEEYETTVQKIIEHMRQTGEWGQFFPSDLSCFGYNETEANEFFPLNKNEALEKGFQWSNFEVPPPQSLKIIPGEKLPDIIEKIPDDILNWAIECPVSKRLFKITQMELKFYRENKIPVPQKHPDIRHTVRMSLRNPQKLWNRDCSSCGKSVRSSYESRAILCEECYLKEIY